MADLQVGTMALRDPDRMFDIRTVRRHIRAGRVSREKFQKFLESRPDVTENIMEPEEGGDTNDGYDERQPPTASAAQDGTQTPS